MLHVAILETEEVTKDIMFTLTTAFPNQEFLFHYYTKISQFAAAEAEHEFHIIIFHENFEIPRVTQSFVLRNTKRIIIYTKSTLANCEKEVLPYARIFYINRKHIKSEITRIHHFLANMLKSNEEYMFSYKNVNVLLKISDIYYIEKQDKNLIYHTKRGQFQERKSMKDAYAYFSSYHFLWIHASYLVNVQYVTKIDHDTIILQKQHLPIARSKKAQVVETLRSFAK